MIARIKTAMDLLRWRWLCRRGLHDWRALTTAEIKECLRTRVCYFTVCTRCGCTDMKFTIQGFWEVDDRKPKQPSYTLNPPAESNPSSITCHVCGMTSYHPKDVEHRYCGNCHLFHA